MHKKLLLLCVLPGLLVVSGCVRKIKSRKLATVSLGMNKQQVYAVLGKPNVIRSSTIDDSQQVLETWEYQVDKGTSDQLTTERVCFTLATLGLGFPVLFADGDIVEPYWFFFKEDKLVKWCKGVDQEIIKHTIQEKHFG